jgi:nitrate reductase NapE component
MIAAIVLTGALGAVRSSQRSPRSHGILGFIAIAALIAAALLGRRALPPDPGLRKAIASLLFCAVAATATSYTRIPIVIWPLGIAMLGAMLFLVWTMHGEAKRRRA